jgi:hypothetical protein
MGRILLGIIVLLYALRMSRNIYRDIKRTESGNETRYLFGIKTELWKDPIPKEKRVIVLLTMAPFNFLLYFLAAVVLFNINLSTFLPFLNLGK